MAMFPSWNYDDVTPFGIRSSIKRIVDCIRQVLDGRINSSGSVTLTASAATTVVTDRRVGRDSVILFMPLTANAAAEVGNGTMYVQTTDIDPLNNQFTINHANNGQTDRNFRYVILGSELS